jgi:hypothetical protein
MVELAEKIPGPKPLPIVGNALEFGTSTKGTVHETCYEIDFVVWWSQFVPVK